MNYFDILLAKKLSGGSPTPPGDTYERKSVTSYPVTDSANYPLPKVDVTVTDADKCELIVTTDNVITEDSGVYLNRQSGGGNRELDEIVGGSVVWNQLIPKNNKSFSNSTTDTLNYLNLRLRRYNSPYTPLKTWEITQASKLSAIFTSDTSFSGVSLVHVGSLTNINAFVDNNFNIWANHKYMVSFNVTGADVTTVGGFSYTDFNIIDLTTVFGTTIADYIYSLEQATAGSGIAWLKSYGYLTEDYYGYTANKIESVSVARHITRDSNDSVIGSYAINPITLRGIPKLNASNQLYYDGDRYEASGRVTRKYGVVDLGTLTWSYSNSRFNTTTAISDIKTSATDYSSFIICDKYEASQTPITTQDKDKTIATYNGYIYVKDSAYTNAATLKTAMSGVMLVYELATPTTESTSPFEANQIVDANGTEEYIDAGVEAGTRDVAIPVGHETKYYNGKAYVKPLTAGTSDTVSMADMGIMPTSPMYISANGEIDVEYWKQVE